MFELSVFLEAGTALAMVAVVAWLFSVRLDDVSIVDSLWSLMFLIAAVVYAVQLDEPGPRAPWLMLMVIVWAVRLAAHITRRNWGQPEDARYRAIRERNQPHFRFKSLYLVFGLQAALAWVISLPLLAALAGTSPLGVWDGLALALWLAGMFFESVGDWQLARFKADPANRGRVMDRGLWHYTRHPNYFGECLIWWGFFALAVGAGGWWAIISPAIMTLLLLRVSGVALLEKDMVARHPAYRDYMARTNAFFPGLPRHDAAEDAP